MVMTENIDYWFWYWGPYIMHTSIKDSSLIAELLEKAIEQRNDTERFDKLDARSNLVGQMDEEYWYENCNDWFVPKFAPYVNVYLEGLKDYKEDSFEHIYARTSQTQGDSPSRPRNIPVNLEWVLDSFWVNIQKPREYNPTHHHTGDLSFVIYLQVPEGLKKENEDIRGVHNNEGPGMITFDYGEHLPFSIGRVSQMPKVGSVIIFPSWVRHYVTDFKSEGERISAAGNITLRQGLHSEYSEYGVKS